jgi:hypothetical protein
VGTCIELALLLGLKVSALNATVKNHTEIEKSYIQYGPISKHGKSLKMSLIVKLEMALVLWFNQAHMGNSEVSSHHLKEKVLYLPFSYRVDNVTAAIRLDNITLCIR